MMWLSQAMFFSFSIIVAFGVVYNGARIALSERSRDLATLRVLGFTKREVSAILILELAMLTAAAIVPGLLLGRWMTYGLMKYSETEVYRFPVVLTAGTYWIAAGTVLLSSGVSFAAAARKVSSLDLLAVLKSGE
jgi:putative ABC transport system permease protein